MDISKSSQASVVALYGLDAPEALDGLYPAMIQWFQDVGCACDKLGVVGDSFSGKQATFKRLHPRLVKAGLRNVDSVELTSMQAGGKYPLCDWKMKISLKKNPSYFVIGVDAAVAEMSWLLDIARTAIAALRPCYGIGYRREMRRGPTLYAIGLNQGTETYSGPEYEEEVRTTAWGGRAMSSEQYRDGILRDVYPYNFLTAPQLERPVNHMPLKDWIAQDASRGALTEISEGTFEWSVGQNQAGPIPEFLRQERAIFDSGVVR